MISVKIYNRNANDTMEIVRELRVSGLVQGKDFDFAYHRESYDYFSSDAICVIPRHAIFTFYNEKHSTLFLLKYGTK